MYQTEKIYMVDEVPPHLKNDVPIAFPLQCPALQNFLTDNIMWMSSGGTKSVVHTDQVENINCLIRGRKDLVLIDPHKFKSHLPLDKNMGSFSSLDVDAVDYNKFPSMANIDEYGLASMAPGDCLFIPYYWVHQVRSYDRNIAVNLWWDHHLTKQLDPKVCQDTTYYDPSITLSTVDWVKLKETVENRDEKLSFLDDLKRRSAIMDLTPELFMSTYLEENYSGNSIFQDLPASQEAMGVKLVKEIFQQFDPNSDGLVTLEELESLDKKKAKRLNVLDSTIREWVDGLMSKKEKEAEVASTKDEL